VAGRRAGGLVPSSVAFRLRKRSRSEGIAHDARTGGFFRQHPKRKVVAVGRERFGFIPSGKDGVMTSG
jgi:hypothetical protein